MYQNQLRHIILIIALTVAVSLLTFITPIRAQQDSTFQVTSELTSEVAPTDVPPTEVPPTEVPPTEVPPTEVPPTEVPPTEVPPTDVPPTDMPPTDVPPTDMPPTDVPPTDMPPTATPVYEDFQSDVPSAWTFTDGWTLAMTDTNRYLTTSAAGESIHLPASQWMNPSISLRVQGAINIDFNAYRLTLDADGNLALYRDGALLAQAAPAFALEPGWRQLTITTWQGQIAVTLNGMPALSHTETTSATDTAITISTVQAGNVALDDLHVFDLQTPPQPAPTATPDESLIIVIPTAETTAEPTPVPEITAEPEATVEPEATAEPEITIEPEITPEATEETSSQGGGGSTDVPVRIAEAGVYDDVSLYLTYGGNWTPQFDEAFYNDTYHATTETNAALTFHFNGDGFVLNMQGWNADLIYRVEIDTNGGGSQNVFDLANNGLTCNFDGNAPAYNPGNYLTAQRTAWQPVAFGCYGLDNIAPGGQHQLTLTTYTNQQFTVDSIEVRNGGLTAGMYQQNDPWLTINGNWTVYGDAAFDDGWVVYSNTPGDTITLPVNATNAAALAIHQVDWGGVIQVCRDVSASCVTLSAGEPLSVITTERLQLSGTDARVTLRVVSDYVNLDVLHIIERTTPLPAGETEVALDHDDLVFVGDWTPYADAALGEIVYTGLQRNASVFFTVNVSSADDRIMVHQVAEWGGNYRICGTACITADSTRLIDVFSAGDLGISGTAQLYIQQLGTGYFNLDRIEVTGPPSGLVAGHYEQDYFEFDYNTANGWIPANNQTMSGGSLIYYDPGATPLTSGSPSAGTMTMLVDATTTDAITLKTSTDGGQLEVCRNVADTCHIIVSNQPLHIIDHETLGLTGESETVTLRWLSRWTGLDYVRLWAYPDSPLTGGENDPALDNADFAFNGNWTAHADPTSVDNNVVYPNDQPGAAMTFMVDARNATDQITVWQSAEWGGNYQICGQNCINANTLQPIEVFTMSALGYGTVNDGFVPVTIKQVGRGYFNIDRIDVGAAIGLSAGHYEETYFAFDYNLNFTWIPAANAAMSGGSLIYFDPGGTPLMSGSPSGGVMTFMVDTTSTDALILKTSTDGGQLEVCRDLFDNCQPITANTALHTIDHETLGLVGNSATVTLRWLSRWVGLDYVQLLAYPSVIVEGTGNDPALDDARFAFTGSWAAYADPTSVDNNVVYPNNQPGAAMVFAIDGSDPADNVIIWQSAEWGGNYEICGRSCVTANPSQTIDAFPVTALGYGNGADTFVTVTITQIGNGYFNVDRIDISDPSTGLTAARYEENHFAFIYSNSTNWIPVANAAMSGGSLKYHDPGATPLLPGSGTAATLTFRVDATATDALAIKTSTEGGQLEVCRNTNINCEIITANTALHLIDHETLGLTGESETVTLRWLSRWVGLDYVQLLAYPTTPLNGTGNDPALNNTDFTFTGDWLEYADPVSLDGNVIYPNNQPGAAMTFMVDARNATDRVIVWQSALWGGRFQVCGTICITADTTRTVQPFTMEALGYGTSGDGAVYVTIRQAGTGYFNVDRVDVVGDVGPIAPGYYEDTYIDLIYTGTWQTMINATASGGSLRYAGNGGQLSFGITAESPGVVLYFLNGNSTWAGAYDITICPEGAAVTPTNCPVYEMNVPTNTGTTAWTAGHSFYNGRLLSAAAYDVTVTFSGGAGMIYLDAIQVLDGFSTALIPSSTRYEEDHTALTYAPANFWEPAPWSGFSGGNAVAVTHAGGLLQVAFQGDTITLYTMTYNQGSPDVRFCEVRPDADNRCGAFSANTATTGTQVPITLYGFGAGENLLIIENLSDSTALWVDAIEIYAP